MGGLGPQDPHAHRVERRHPHREGPPADEVDDAFLHLPGGLVGEGDGQDLARLCAAGREQVGDASGEHAGLSRSGSGHHQQRRTAVFHRRPLRRIQALQQGGDLLAPVLRAVVRGLLVRRRQGAADPGGRRRPGARPGGDRGGGREVEQARHDGNNATRRDRQGGHMFERAPPAGSTRSSATAGSGVHDRRSNVVYFLHVSARALSPCTRTARVFLRVPDPGARSRLRLPATTTPRGPHRPGAFFVPGSEWARAE